jgi:hypothetical protein
MSRLHNSHVVAYFWFHFNRIEVEKASDAWASMFAMSRYFSEKTQGEAV